jgi:hypothetical protein
MDDRGIGRQFLQKALFNTAQSIRKMTADFFSLLLAGFLCPALSQFAILSVHSEGEKKKDEGRQKNSDPKQKDLLTKVLLGSAGWERVHAAIVSFSKAELS